MLNNLSNEINLFAQRINIISLVCKTICSVISLRAVHDAAFGIFVCLSQIHVNPINFKLLNMFSRNCTKINRDQSMYGDRKSNHSSKEKATASKRSLLGVTVPREENTQQNSRFKYS